MGVTAKQRASLALKGETGLSPEAVCAAVKEVAAAVHGGGKSLLTTGVANVGAQVHVVSESDGQLRFAITSGKKLVKLCTFSAAARRHGDRTQVTVGGVDSYRTQQSKLLMFIPVGPKQIYGMDPYKRFLTAVNEHIASIDPSASLSIGQAA